jgi:thiol-disulfide isomerase/thioredoxin
MTKLLSIIILSLLLLAPGPSNAQSIISGTFAPLAQQQVKLVGFNGFDTYLIDSTRADQKGVFKLRYHSDDTGMGYLAGEDEKPFIVILGGEDIVLQGEAFSLVESIVIIEGKENQLFGQYATEHPRREQALSAWDYLQRIYEHDPLFSGHEVARMSIKTEQQRIKQEDSTFLASLGRQSYVSWFLPVRKLVSSVSVVAQYRTAEIPAAISAFRQMDYTDIRLYKSGLLREAIEAHFWLIENSGRPLDSVFLEMNISIDHMVASLLADQQKFREINGYLFNLLEQRSLFGSSEYLALKLLTKHRELLDDDFAGRLESYRAMKIGNTAPEILFSGNLFKNGMLVSATGKLSELTSEYVIVAFGSSDCPMCADELQTIRALYPKWNRKGVEVLYVSLDSEKELFARKASGLPFLSYNDYLHWESPPVKDYYVFATPTFYLLDASRNIILRPHSARQLDAWVDFYLKD